MQLVTHPLVEKVIGCALAVHRALGPDLPQSTYCTHLCRELAARKIPFRTKAVLPAEGHATAPDGACRVALVVDDWLIVEVKAVAAVLPIHLVQLMTCLRLAGCRQGLIVNFSVPRLRDGLRRVVPWLPPEEVPAIQRGSRFPSGTEDGSSGSPDPRKLATD